MNPLTLLARALDALLSLVPDDLFDVFPEGDSLDTHLPDDFGGTDA